MPLPLDQIYGITNLASNQEKFMEKKKMGRPFTCGEKKTSRCEIRMSGSDEKMLNECCSALGKTRTEILKYGLRLVYQSIK